MISKPKKKPYYKRKFVKIKVDTLLSNKILACKIRKAIDDFTTVVRIQIHEIDKPTK